MGDPDNPLSTARPRATPTSIPPLSRPGSSTPSSSFPSLKQSSVSRKKPEGLSITRSIRPAPSPPTDGSPALTGKKGSIGWVSETDRLRQDIERLQLSSKSSSSLDSPESSSPTAPTTPTHLAQSDSSSSSRSKKSSSSKAKRTKDKNGDDLVKDEDLDIMQDLGAGNGGTVTKVWNKKRKCIMARKLILVDAKPSVRKQILRELQIMNDCSSPYIVGYYGCFPVDVHVGIVMEYMDATSLDHIYRNTGPVPIDMVGKVAEAVLRGLMYLYDVHRIIHRDIKPSNILANTAGDIKICDFGVSGELINSIANTFVGTSTYMSPERIQGAPYTIKSDVWSLGISLIELAHGRFPFSDSADEALDFDPDPTLSASTQRPTLSNKPGNPRGGARAMSILDLLQHIVNEPAPKLGTSRRDFPSEAVEFVRGCLDKDPSIRQSPQELLKSKWIVDSQVTKDQLKAWTRQVAPSDD
ncbi:kinase-like domain-containing protein [Kockovaella imperatae]|uniref:Kinase-like domain-containing protein n=1 Tax=Kockovaella imperatae TaxID=4999 RepID=A0A1Y1UD96_9TREE|nr:kinase-like domain-containing protein [Kockovaella imperatae]ORX35992.1 kinase-like domain-containing protein [Kockovaella imperatae]